MAYIYPDEVNLPPTTSNSGPFHMLNTESSTVDPLASAYDDKNEINPTSFQFMIAGVPQSNPYVAAAGTWSANAAGEVTFTPAGGFVGSASIGFRVADLDGAYSNVSTITFNVSEPVAASVCDCNHPGQDNDCCDYVGLPLGMDGPGNVQLRANNYYLAQPFCCRETGTITHYSVNIKYATDRAGYSAGNLGDIQTCLYNADENGNPYGSALGCHVLYDPALGGSGTNDGGNLGKWAFPSPISVVAGQNYALVHNNIDPSPNTNWCSINLGRDYPHAGVQPDFQHRQFATGNFVFQPRHQGPGNYMGPTTNAPNWWKGDPNAGSNTTNGTMHWHNNCFAVYMASGTRMGFDYVGGRFNDEFTMNSTQWVRTYFKTPSEKITTGPVHFKTTFGAAGGTVTGRLYENSSLIRTITLSPTGPYWYGGTVSPAVTFNPANTYRVEWSSSVNISLRAVHTSRNNQGWEEDTANADNHLLGHTYQRSTNSGGTWASPVNSLYSSINFYFETDCVGAAPTGTLSFTTGVSNETAPVGGSATFDWTVTSSNACTPITYQIQTSDGVNTYNFGTTQTSSYTFSNLQASDTNTTVIVTATCPGNTSVQDTGLLTVTGGGAGLPAGSKVHGAFHSFGSTGLNPDSSKNMPTTMNNQVTAAGWVYDGKFSEGGMTPAGGLAYVQANQAAWQDCQCMFIDFGVNFNGTTTAQFVSQAMAINNHIRSVVPTMKIIWANIFTTTSSSWRIPLVNPGVQQMYNNGDIDGIADWHAIVSNNTYMLHDGTHPWHYQDVWMSTFIAAAQQIS